MHPGSPAGDSPQALAFGSSGGNDAYAPSWAAAVDAGATNYWGAGGFAKQACNSGVCVQPQAPSACFSQLACW